MTGKLAGKIALITGASRGIGAEIAKAYAQEGAHVILLARTVGALEELDDEIRSFGGQATLMPLDLRDISSLDALGPTILNHFGKLDIFVGNAGLLGDLSPVAQSDARLWDEVMTVNLLANHRLIRTLDPLLRASDAGRAIFVSSSVARREAPYWGAYAVSKAALEKMIETYALEVATSPLKVNLINPGATRTAMREKAMPGENPETVKPASELVPLFIQLALDTETRHGDLISA